jgi:hypothetical protein
MAQTLGWARDECGQPIAEDQGHITCDYADTRAHRAAAAYWERRHNPPGKLNVHQLSPLLEYPQQVEWRVLHGKCDPRPDSTDYWIAVKRARTVAELLDLTTHLLETKNWLSTITWNSILRRRTNALGQAA